MEQRFETMLIDQCAPTLAGVKPASLFRLGGLGRENLRRLVQRWDRRLAAKGIRVRILKECPRTDAAMIYVYRADRLAKLLAEPENRAFLLERMGYRDGGTEELLEQLSHRLCLEEDYPHEIGVFLGYPLEDVVGFIDNRGWNYTCCGYWKAYGDPRAAQRRFACYRSCTDQYRRMYARGIPVMGLAVAA